MLPQYYPFPIPSGSTHSRVDWNGSPQIDGNRVIWHFTDWKPVEDLTITLSGDPYSDDSIDEL